LNWLAHQAFFQRARHFGIADIYTRDVVSAILKNVL
jgi:hypothetical protein